MQARSPTAFRPPPPAAGASSLGLLRIPRRPWGGFGYPATTAGLWEFACSGRGPRSISGKPTKQESWSIRNAQTYGRGCLRAFGMLKPMAEGASEHSECSNPCSAIVGEHSECSNQCSAIVGEHSECSNRCSAIVGEHSECFCSLVYKAFASAHPRDRARMLSAPPSSAPYAGGVWCLSGVETTPAPSVE